MFICNNATITFNGTIPEKVMETLNADFSEIGTFDKNVLYIEDVYGDIRDDLNEIVDALTPHGIKPLVGEYNRYYGDYEGCATCSATSLKR